MGICKLASNGSLVFIKLIEHRRLGSKDLMINRELIVSDI